MYGSKVCEFPTCALSQKEYFRCLYFCRICRAVLGIHILRELSIFHMYSLAALPIIAIHKAQACDLVLGRVRNNFSQEPCVRAVPEPYVCIGVINAVFELIGGGHH